MKSVTSCDRFERDGVLALERGLALDAHFEDCADCRLAREKHASILAALPLAVPEVRAPIGWQARVLRETKPAVAREKRHETPEVLAFVGLAAMVAAAFFGVAKRSSLDSLDVTADWSAKSNSPVVEERSTEGPSPLQDRTPKELRAAEPQRMPVPMPIAPMPKSSPRVVAPLFAMPEEPSAAKAEAPLVAAPDTAPMAEGSTGKAASRHKVTRPSQLYGFQLVYPKAAKDARIQGETSVQCTIRKDGKNTNCRVLKSLPFLDEPLLAALAAAKSDPITVDGKPVDNSDHIWHITIKLVDPIAPYNPARGLPVVTWKNSAP